MHSEEFRRLGIEKGFLGDALEYFHFETPSPVQREAIPKILRGDNLLVQGKNGTGKTLAFTCALLQQIDHLDYRLQALILSPTREIAAQTFDFINEMTFTAPQPIYTSLSCGGYSLRDNIKGLCKGCQVVVGTPGRVLDLIGRKKAIVKLQDLKILVLDEADEMTRMKEFSAIAKELPGGCQVLCFSATYTERSLKLLNATFPSLTRVFADGEDQHLPNLREYHYLCSNRESALLSCLRTVDFHQAIVFFNSKAKGELMAARLREEGLPCLFVSGDMPQEQRIEAIKALRFLGVRVLLSTDLTSRGIDVLNVNLTVNFDLPSQKQVYVHRIGRAGRYGTPGVAVALITPDQLPILESFSPTEDFKKYDSSAIKLPELLEAERPLLQSLMFDSQPEEGEVRPPSPCSLCRADPGSVHCHCAVCRSNYSILLSLLATPI